MSKILITGGLGFIGSHLADKLSKKNKVTIIDKLSKRVHPYKNFVYKPKNCEIIYGDINNKSLLKDILSSFDFIYHFASHQDHQKDYSSFIDDNVRTIALIFEILKKSKNNKLKQIILSSSQSVYGEGYYKYEGKNYLGKRKFKDLKNKKWFIKNKSEKFIRHKEIDEPKPINIYGLSKLFQENIIKQCSKELDINYTILRYSIVQGPRQSFFNSYSGLCRNLISCYMRNERPIIFEDGLSTRDFVNIDDVTKANVKVLGNKITFNQTLNIGGDKSYSLIEFDEIIRKKMKTNIKPIINQFFRDNDPRDTISDISKAKRILNWKPTKTIEYSIDEYIKWVKKNTKALSKSKSSVSKMIEDGSAINCS